MALDPQLLKQLIVTFEAELEEQSQVITNGLISLEKANLTEADQAQIIESIFRAGHNVKGAARSLNIKDVGEIAHRIETLFSGIQKKQLAITANIIDLCLEAVDDMRSALQAFINNVPIAFDLESFLVKLENAGTDNAKTKQLEPIKNDPIVQVEAAEHESVHLPVDNRTSKESIRIPIDKIDKISALMEELQVNKISIDDHYMELIQLTTKIKHFSEMWKNFFSGAMVQLSKEMTENLQKIYDKTNDSLADVNEMINKSQKNMRSRINDLGMLSSSLQEEVRMLRLVSANNLLSLMPRYVRELAKELNKKIELTIKGDDVKIDKVVLEGLKDPINHLLRNAIDHGIESIAIRKQKGKSEAGHIQIEILEAGDQILINVTDDGAGIDVEQVTETIKKNKLATDLEINAMSEDDILAYVFRPNFSTKKIITDISGRGVGLDVVKNNISNLKGHVGLKTRLEQGTTFTLRVPLTLSSQRGLLIKSAGQLFVIPTASVERVFVMPSNKVVEVDGAQAIVLDQRTISLRILDHVLGFNVDPLLLHDQISIVVMENSWAEVALVVEEIIGEREIVIKPIQAPMSHTSCVMGGTLLDNNQVVMVFDPVELMKKILHVENVSRLSLREAEVKAMDLPHILVVDDSITTRTLEKNILESKNYKVSVAVNGKEAWDLLQKTTFSLMITDIDMPIMNGLTLTEKVKNSEKLRILPVIIVTSLGSDAEKKRGIDVGADAYIVKNEFESGNLLDIVAQLV